MYTSNDVDILSYPAISNHAREVIKSQTMAVVDHLYIHFGQIFNKYVRMSPINSLNNVQRENWTGGNIVWWTLFILKISRMDTFLVILNSTWCHDYLFSCFASLLHETSIMVNNANRWRSIVYGSKSLGCTTITPAGVARVLDRVKARSIFVCNWSYLETTTQSKVLSTPSPQKRPRSWIAVTFLIITSTFYTLLEHKNQHHHVVTPEIKASNL